MLVTAATWEWLRLFHRQKHSSAEAYADQILAQLRVDFDSTFAAIKTQRLLTRARDKAYVDKVTKHILNRVSKLPCSSEQRGKLRRHCAASLFFQTALEELNKTSSDLSIWNGTFRDIAIATIAAVEHTFLENIYSPKTLATSEIQPSTVMREVDAETRWMRDLCDWALMILNEGGRTVQVTPPAEISIEMVRQAFDVARKTEQIEAIWDFYTFYEVEAHIRGDEMHFDRLPRDVERNQLIGYFRVGRNDLDQNFVNHAEFARVRERYAAALNELPDLTLEEFLPSEICRNLLGELSKASTEARQRLNLRLLTLVDIDKSFRLPSGKFTYRELTRFWIFLYQFTYVLQVWCVQGARERNSAKPCIISVTALAEFASTALSEPLEKARSYLRQFTSTAERRIDLFYRPLLQIGENQLLIATAPIQMNRFDQNLIHILVSEVSLDVSEKGKRPLTILQDQFSDAGYGCASEVPVLKDGRTLTDLDLMSYKDGILFIFQSKVLAISDSAYDIWRSEQAMLEAASQMDICLSKVHEIVDTRRAQLKIRGTYEVVPLLLTNIWDFTGRQIGGFPVTDFSYLGNLLEGAEVRVKTLGRRGVLGGLRLIDGEYPSGPELKRLLLNPVHGKFINMEGEYTEEIFSTGSKSFRTRVRVVKREDVPE